MCFTKDSAFSRLFQTLCMQKHYFYKLSTIFSKTSAQDRVHLQMPISLKQVQVHTKKCLENRLEVLQPQIYIYIYIFPFDQTAVVRNVAYRIVCNSSTDFKCKMVWFAAFFSVRASTPTETLLPNYRLFVQGNFIHGSLISCCVNRKETRGSDSLRRFERVRGQRGGPGLVMALW